MLDPLVELLKTDECRPLLTRLQKKMQQGKPMTGRCRFNKLSGAQAGAISKLTGTAVGGGGMTIDLDLFSQVIVNTGRFESLESLVQQASDQPIKNLRAARDEHAAQWRQLWQHVQMLVENLRTSRLDSLENQSPPYRIGSDSFTVESVADAVAAIRKSGWLRRVTSQDVITATSLLDQAFALLKRLPTNPVPLPVFAAKQCGSAHALDDNTSLSRVMLKLLTTRPADGSQVNKAQKKALTRRRIWESVGIVTDELSSTVLLLNLPACGDSPTDRLLRDHHQCGMPGRVTFRHLRLHPPAIAIPGGTQRSLIYVCENPSVLAEAANRLGADCPTIVCVEGHPSLACWVLLDQLCGTGFELTYHGDFDWGGIRIANEIYTTFGFKPWRFTSSHHHVRSNHHRKLRGPESAALWDETLTETIRRAGVSIEEESMIEELLADLGTTPT